MSEGYRVIRRIGEGSFSQVLKCQDKTTGLFYAGKRLKKIYLSINEIMKSPEIIVLRKINRHPNILYMIEFHHDPLPGKVTLIFELMDMSLYDMIKNRKGHIMTEQRVKIYLYQLLRGLEHLHNHGIFHRDIKPENILVKGKVVKLADLGSIRGIYSTPPYTEYISTRWYRSPECLLTNGFYGPKMDIWALGCVFYELLTLKPLFPGCDEIDQITKIHTILGSPHPKVIAKFRRHKSKNCEYIFPNKGGKGFNNLLPHITDMGREVLKLMLIYDPENRSNAKRLLEHRYLNNLRIYNALRNSNSFILSTISRSSSQWYSNPVLLSYITSQKRQLGYKPMNICQSKIMVETSNKVPKIIASSSINTRKNVLNDSRIGKVISSDKDDPAIVLIHEAKNNLSKSWRTNCILSKIQINESPKSDKYIDTKFSMMKHGDAQISCKTGNFPQQLSRKYIEAPVCSQYNLRSTGIHSHYNGNVHDDKIHMNRNYFSFLSQIVQKPEHYHSEIPIGSVPRQQMTMTQVDGGKRKTRLAAINEMQITVPHTRSSNIKSPAKKIAKRETTTKSLGKLISVKKTVAPFRRLRGK